MKTGLRVSRFSPRKRPAVIVVPERDDPRDQGTCLPEPDHEGIDPVQLMDLARMPAIFSANQRVQRGPPDLQQ